MCDPRVSVSTAGKMATDKFEVLTFDCYGTLIDWESGILGALRPVLSAHRINLTDPEVLGRYAEMEAQAEEGPFVPYTEVLIRVVQQMGDVLGFVPSQRERNCLWESLAGWSPFPDAVRTLKRLEEKYRLAIISNDDDDLLSLTARLLDARFHWTVTSEAARSYKPSLNNFRLAMRTIGIPRERILHVAESIRHDIRPAATLGISTVWVNRGKARGSDVTASGTASASTTHPDLEVPDLDTLASLLGCDPG